jgi:hypothetical protein
MDEARLALEKGYKILEVYEVYEYRVTRYDPHIARASFSWTI